MSDVLSVSEVAALMDCAEVTVEEEARRRLLPGVKLGRSWRFPRGALLQVLNERALKNLQEEDTANRKALAVYDAMRDARVLRAPPKLPELN